MGDIIEFPMQDMSIEIERTEEFYKSAKEVSEFIKALPLSHADNDKLIALLLEQTKQAEKGAFMQGFKMGALTQRDE